MPQKFQGRGRVGCFSSRVRGVVGGRRWELQPPRIPKDRKRLPNVAMKGAEAVGLETMRHTSHHLHPWIHGSERGQIHHSACNGVIIQTPQNVQILFLDPQGLTPWSWWNPSIQVKGEERESFSGGSSQCVWVIRCENEASQDAVQWRADHPELVITI